MIYTEASWPSHRWPNFTFDEMKCSHTGECFIDDAFMDALQDLRDNTGPLTITSGYRHPTHPAEATKPRPGSHSRGMAADIAVRGGYDIVKAAYAVGMTGIGISQSNKGARFIHLDRIPLGDPDIPRPALWSY